MWLYPFVGVLYRESQENVNVVSNIAKFHKKFGLVTMICWSSMGGFPRSCGFLFVESFYG